MRHRNGPILLVIVVLAAGLSLLSGCARTVPQEVTDVNRALQDAKDACASVYASDSLGSVQSDVDSMNALADDKKYRKAKKEAEPLAGRVSDLGDEARSARDAAKGKADAAVDEAEAAVAAARSAGAGEHAAGTLGSAEGKLKEAQAAATDPCRYNEAVALAGEAGEWAGKAADEAAAEKARLEEERRRAEEEAKRKAEEERRRAEEERLRRFPPSYTVQRGDSLWSIAGMETVYGDPTYWPLLYRANADDISDPDLIYPGQELTIPRDMSDEEMEDALKKMWRRMASVAEE